MTAFFCGVFFAKNDGNKGNNKIIALGLGLYTEQVTQWKKRKDVIVRHKMKA